MPDWTKSMQQSYEYYIVDPNTWLNKKRLKDVKTCEITRDEAVETRGSSTIGLSENVGECYIRAYLVTNQNGIEEKFPLSTFLVQTPSSAFDGKAYDISIDGYTSLLELKEGLPPIGYYIPEESNIMEYAYALTREQVRAPVTPTSSDEKLHNDFVSNADDNWLTYIRDLLLNAKYELDVDAMGNILFAPIQDLHSLQPVWTYKDDNSSILHCDISIDHDLYGIPNVVEVVYSNASVNLYAKVINDDPNSPISTVNRGREIVRRVTNPEIVGNVTQQRIQEYAEQALRQLSSLEYRISYTHGYCPVRLGDCVRLDYSRAGLHNIKAKVVRQTISCETSCQVTEEAVFTKQLWGDTI